MPMTREEYLLTCLTEEAAEVIHRAAKAKRFGMKEIQPGQPHTNADRIAQEFGDFLGVYELLVGHVQLNTDTPAIQEKRERVEAYYARYVAEHAPLPEAWRQ